MAQTQFYFVDACRSYMDEFGQRFYGNGLSVPLEYPGKEDRRAAPIFYGAVSGATAKGIAGNGTLFARALMSCLSGKVESAIEKRGSVQLITAHNLATALQNTLETLAADAGVEQWFTLGGANRYAVVQTLQEPTEPPPQPFSGAQVVSIPKDDLALQYKPMVDALLNLEGLGTIRNFKSFSGIDPDSDDIDDAASKKDVLEVVEASEVVQHELHLEQNMRYLGKGWWWWTVGLDGLDAKLNEVERVEYTLHDSFSKPVVSVDDRETRFAIQQIGWGEFEIKATVTLREGKTMDLSHWLVLIDDKGGRCKR